LSGRGLCDELITRPEESYRLCCVVVCDLETSRMVAPCIYDISHLRVKDLVHALDILTAHGFHSVSTEIKQIIKPQLSCLFYTTVLFNFLKLPTSFGFLLHFPACASVLKRSFNLVLSVSHLPVWIAHISTHLSISQPHNHSHLRSSLTLLFEARGRIISTAAFYSGAPGFKSMLEDRLF